MVSWLTHAEERPPDFAEGMKATANERTSVVVAADITRMPDHNNRGRGGDHDDVSRRLGAGPCIALENA